MQKVLIVSKMNIRALILSLVCLRCRFSIYYVRISPILNNKLWYDRLAQWGVVGLSYEVHSQNTDFKLHEIALRFVKQLEGDLGRTFMESDAFKVVSDHLAMDDEALTKFRVYLKSVLMRHTSVLYECLVFAEHLGRTSGKSVFLWHKGNALERAMNRRAFPEVSPLGGSRFSPLFNTLFLSDSTISPSIRSWLRRLLKESSYARKLRAVGRNRSQAPVYDNRVLFFPHIGLFYGDFFVKDHYYASRPDSHFAKSKILHLSLGDPREDPTSPTFELQRTFEYYAQNSIPHDDWYRFSRSPDASQTARRLLKGCKIQETGFKERALAKFRRNLFQDTLVRIQDHLARCAHVPNAKVALIGYDVLFSGDLAVALAIRGIHTVASQERFSQPFCFSFFYKLIVDHYFVNGEAVKEWIEQHPCYFAVGEATAVGAVRVDLIHRYRSVLRVAPDKRYARMKEKHRLVFAFDYYSSKSFAENRLRMGGNWATNKRFYLDTLRLAEAMPDIFIVIKGKNTWWEEIPEFADISGLIEASPNIAVERDLVNYNPYLPSAWADACYGMHTSLGDEFMAAEIPFVWYDYIGFPTAYYDYEGFPVVARTFEELRLAVGRLVRDAGFAQTDEMKAMRRRLYASCYDGQVGHRIHEQIERIRDTEASK